MIDDEDAAAFVKRVAMEHNQINGSLSMLGEERYKELAQLTRADSPSYTKSAEVAWAAILVTAVNALLVYLSNSSKQEITIRDSDGSEVKIPKNTSQEDIDYLLTRLFQETEHPQIVAPNISQEDWEQVKKEFWKKMGK